MHSSLVMMIQLHHHFQGFGAKSPELQEAGTLIKIRRKSSVGNLELRLWLFKTCISHFFTITLQLRDLPGN